MTTPATVLITGASSGIGATYAERFARHGHDLMPVARDKARLETLPERLRKDTSVAVDVLPAATRTEIWERAAIDLSTLSEVMDVEELIEAALVGYDRRELVAIAPLHAAGRWDALDQAHQGLLSDIRQAHAAELYQAQAIYPPLGQKVSFLRVLAV
ncbi:SDR family NAD(P)-dependent oxidoreductase [Pseudomonas sp. EL_65y_Pfl1_R83]|uniref:SDR family NAD(P)-dependent oxidoreductase n=1 Tax=Pseudomonas sp. EL_65y_Pfl1_R83 TaxID=3088697 RepID=UPI0030DBAC95